MEQLIVAKGVGRLRPHGESRAGGQTYAHLEKPAVVGGRSSQAPPRAPILAPRVLQCSRRSGAQHSEGGRGGLGPGCRGPEKLGAAGRGVRDTYSGARDSRGAS